jgi:tetratricopeptide (TPR) repeat protein
MSNSSEITNTNIYNSTVNNSVTQILANYEEYEGWKKDLELLTETLGLISENKNNNRSKLELKIISLKERIKNYELHLEKALGEIKVNLEYQEKAILALKEGHANQAKNLLIENSSYINEIEAKANNKLLEVTKAKSDIANHFLLLAFATQADYTNPNHYHDTRKFFERSIENHENIDNLDAYAHYLFINKQHSEALTYYQKIIKNYSEKLSKHNLALVLANFAIIYSVQHNYSQALDLYKQINILWNEFYDESDDSLAFEKSKLLNNLALLHRNMNNYEDALQIYEESLSILYKLSAKEPTKYERDIARTLNNLGVQSRNKNDLVNAVNYYTKAINIQRNLVNDDSKYLPDLAMSLGNFGVLLNDQEKFEDSINTLKEALAIYKELSMQNPQMFLLELIKTYKNLGVLYYKTENLEYAEENYTIAKNLLHKSFDNQHTEALLELAHINSNLSLTYRTSEKYEDALEESKSALKIYEKILQKDSTSYLYHKAKIQNNLGLIYGDIKDYNKAIKSFEDAIEINYSLVKLNSEVYSPDLAGSLINISIFYQNIIKNRSASIKYAIEALLILRPFTENIPYLISYYVNTLIILDNWGLSDKKIDQLIKEKEMEMREDKS